MVRVISVHNFPKQNVTTVEDISAVAAGTGGKLFLAHKDQGVVVKQNDLLEETALPTVDQPISLQYSAQGNYVATLEARGDVNFVRVYLGWNESNGTAPLRARIAGRVTPQSQQSEGVEMLEVPTPAMPDKIAVCPVSGNLLVGSQGLISIFKYTVQTHDISRIEFVDFFKTNWNLDLGFTPTSISLCEDVVAAFNDRYLVVFRITSGLRLATPENGKVSSSKMFKSGPIDYNKLVAASEPNDIGYKRHVFPSVAAEPHVTNTPFLIFPEFSPRVSFDSAAKEEPLRIVKLIQLQLASCGYDQRDGLDTFTCLLLKPYYAKEESSSGKRVNLLGSSSYPHLKCISCFFATQQEGYLHHCFSGSENTTMIATYPFTASLLNVVLEDSLLHALTEAGLETYTLRAPLLDNSYQPSSHNDPICLLGLRPFVHVRRLLLGDGFVYLLVSDGSGSAWTIYQLALSDPNTLFGDFLNAARENRWDAPSSYSHLLREANALLRARCQSLKFDEITGRDKSEKEGFQTVDSLYKQSCALLADFYMLLGTEKEAADHYKLSDLKLADVVKRIQGLYKDIPDQYKAQFSEETLQKRCLFNVKEYLKAEDERYEMYGSNREEFYNPDIANMLAVVLDIVDKEDTTGVAEVILSSPVLQQFGSDRSLSILAGLKDPQPADSLALSLICLQRGQTEKASALLATLDHSYLEPLLIRHHHVLFEQSESFSELAILFMGLNQRFLATILSTICTEKKLVSFDVVHKILMKLIQNCGVVPKNTAADILEILVERQFEKWVEKSEEKSANAKETVNTLTWLYLTRLSQQRESHNDGECLFIEARPKFLDHLPPFGPDLGQVLSPQHSPAIDNGEPKNVLKKLQSILASDVARDSLYRVRVLLLQTPKVYGSLSIQVQCAAPAEAVQLLVNFAPQALIPYLKEKRMDETSWKNLIEHLGSKVASTQDGKVRFYYEQLQSSVLEHIAQNLSLEDLADLLPPECPSRNHYLRQGYNHQYAKQIRSLIMMTGSQLL